MKDKYVIELNAPAPAVGNEFEGQVAVVTGAASGIGFAIAQKLLESGAYVAVLDINGKSLFDKFEKYEDRAFISAMDITDQLAIPDAVNEIIARFGAIDILVNSAGITGKSNILSHEVAIEDLRHVFDVNFMSCFYITKAVLPGMIKRKYGRILNLASIAGKEGNAGMLAYSASKAAVIGMTKVQGKEYAETGVTINAMAPAVIRTPLVDNMPDEQVKYMTDKIPMKRCGTLEEAVNMAMYIVSRKNSFTTGFTFDLTGGRATY
jgi:NAD(P)-dependent dehydrogenase (short-subunit alcohol dehydrogenase family)